MAESKAEPTKDAGRRRRHWFAGLALAGLLLVPACPLVLHELARTRHPYDPFWICRSHLDQCNRALITFVKEHGGVFPRFENDTEWAQTARPSFTDDEAVRFEVLHCPETLRRIEASSGALSCRKAPPASVTDYAFNMKLCGRKLADVSPQELLLLEPHSFGHPGSPTGITVEGIVKRSVLTGDAVP